MRVKNILILGSTLLTELCVNRIKESYKLVGFIPSRNPTKQGRIDLPEVDINEPCDIKLSIQYDRMIKEVNNSFNLHTGLLPRYGGTNLLDYSLKNQEVEQGLTLHKMTDKLDYGPIISKMTYPIFPEEKAVDLYHRALTIAPEFLLSSLGLLESLTENQVDSCHKEEPTIYKRGEFEASQEMKDYNYVRRKRH